MPPKFDSFPAHYCFQGWTLEQWAAALALHAQLTKQPVLATEEHFDVVQHWWHTQFLDEPLTGAMAMWHGEKSPYAETAKKAALIALTATKLSYWAPSDKSAWYKACQILGMSAAEERQLLGEDDD